MTNSNRAGRWLGAAVALVALGVIISSWPEIVRYRRISAM